MTRGVLLAELGRNGIELNELARVVLAHDGFATSEASSVFGIAEISVGELGLAHGATLGQVFARAAERGLSLCPLEVAPHLRLQYTDQPEGDQGQPSTRHRAPPGSLTIASQPLVTDADLRLGFYLRRIQGVLWLRGYRSPADHVWSAGDRFVFGCSGNAPGASARGATSVGSAEP